jgi:3-methylcrotonyl-CoA carboxylase beta subunit
VIPNKVAYNDAFYENRVNYDTLVEDFYDKTASAMAANPRTI